VSASETLRPYQSTDLARILEAMRSRRAVLYALPTGAGKTVVAVAAISAFLAAGKRVLFVAHRRELVNQARARLLAAGLPPESVGVVMSADRRARPGAPVQVASVQTLARREMPAFDVAVIDEAHHAIGKSYRRILATAHRTLGLTATPSRLDGQPLRDSFSQLITGPTISELIASGFLAQARTWTVEDAMLPDVSGVGVANGDYRVGELDAATNRPLLVGNLVEHWTAHADGRATLVFATSVAHSKSIRAEFDAAGIRAEHIDAETQDDVRDTITTRLESGETQVVTNCGIWLEGWDLPQIKCVVLARPTKSLGLYLQMVGRCVRPWRGVDPIVLDHAGNAVAHGLPQDDREWSLKARAKGGGGAGVWTCPECFEIVPALTRECDCGHVFFSGEPPDLEPAAGELVEAERRVCECCGVERSPRARATPLCRRCSRIQSAKPDLDYEQIRARIEALDNPRCACCREPTAVSAASLCRGCGTIAGRNPSASHAEILKLRGLAKDKACPACGTMRSKHGKTGSLCASCGGVKAGLVAKGLSGDISQIKERRVELERSKSCLCCGEPRGDNARKAVGMCQPCGNLRRLHPDWANGEVLAFRARTRHFSCRYCGAVRGQHSESGLCKECSQICRGRDLPKATVLARRKELRRGVVCGCCGAPKRTKKSGLCRECSVIAGGRDVSFEYIAKRRAELSSATCQVCGGDCSRKCVRCRTCGRIDGGRGLTDEQIRQRRALLDVTHCKCGERLPRHKASALCRRCARAEKEPRAILTAAQVVQIRSRAAAGDSYASMAREYGVSSSVVSKAARGETWRHISALPPSTKDPE